MLIIDGKPQDEYLNYNNLYIVYMNDVFIGVYAGGVYNRAEIGDNVIKIMKYTGFRNIIDYIKSIPGFCGTEEIAFFTDGFMDATYSVISLNMSNKQQLMIQFKTPMYYSDYGRGKEDNTYTISRFINSTNTFFLLPTINEIEKLDDYKKYKHDDVWFCLDWKDPLT